MKYLSSVLDGWAHAGAILYAQVHVPTRTLTDGQSLQKEYWPTRPEMGKRAEIPLTRNGRRYPFLPQYLPRTVSTSRVLHGHPIDDIRPKITLLDGLK